MSIRCSKACKGVTLCRTSTSATGYVILAAPQYIDQVLLCSDPYRH